MNEMSELWAYGLQSATYRDSTANRESIRHLAKEGYNGMGDLHTIAPKPSESRRVYGIFGVPLYAGLPSEAGIGFVPDESGGLIGRIKNILTKRFEK